MKDMVQVRRGQQTSYKGPDAKIGRSQFNRSHGLKMSFNASWLIPILVDEVLPGDTFTCRLNGFARIFSPLDAPVMDNIELETFFFFCPSRLLWENWENFQGAHVSAGAQDTTYTIPVMATGITVDHDPASGTTVHSLAAYLGLPHGLTSSTNPPNSLPFRMYQFLYNEWFRDQNVSDFVGQDASTVGHTRGNGPDVLATHVLRRSNKKHDYFTSALPYLQKGTAISIAVGGLAPVTGIAKNNQVFTLSPSGYETDGTNPTYTFGDQIDGASVNEQYYVEGTAASGGYPKIYADLGQATGLSINALRESVAIQRLLERDARGGTRYVESIKAHFGVTSPDFRLQRPEYLGGGKSLINISPVANTSGTATEDQAELRGIGTGVINGHSWAKSFTEHGYIMGLVRARGDLTYFQGVDKLWTRSTRYDFYIPALANLGEQAILNQELYISNDSNDVLVFGYQERWAEYRTKMSRITGNFNPAVTGALDHWHLAEDFSTLPALNITFISDRTPMNRITTVDTEEDFLIDVWFDYKCARPIPVRSVPALVSRF